MNENSNEQDAVRNYLLGNLGDKAKRRQIEKRLLLDDDFGEQLSIAEDELVDEYLNDALTETERERFLQFFLIPPERKEKLRFIGNLHKYAAAVRASVQEEVKESRPKKIDWFDWRRLFSSPAWRFATIALLVFGVGFGTWRTVFYQSDTDRGLAQLRLAYRNQRPLESRTTANFGYAPFSTTRGDKPTVTDDKALRIAGNYLFTAAEDPADAEAHHAAGLLYLSEKNFIKALDEFNLALKLAPDNAKLQNDIGALYLEKAKIAEDKEKVDEAEIMENLVLAPKFIDRALEIDPSLLEALFNKAIFLQKTRLPDQAQTAWEEYLKRDSKSPWADEARRNLELLKQQSRAPKDKSQILQDFLDAFHDNDDARAWQVASQTKELIKGVMIQPQLAQKFLEADRKSRKEEADEIFSAFVYLGELEKRNAKDLYFSELAGYYRNTNQAQRQKLLEAHKALQDGHKLIEETNFKPALEVLENAKNLFAEAGDDWEAKIESRWFLI